MRRIPEDVQAAMGRDAPKFERRTLDTQSLEQAISRRNGINREVEKYWQHVRTTGLSDDAAEKYEAAVKLAQRAGFEYLPAGQLSDQVNEVVLRLDRLETTGGGDADTTALLGLVKEPELLISGMLAEYEKHAPEKTTGKTGKDLKKWQNPRTKAAENLRALVGDKALSSLGKPDARRLREWWIDRIAEEGLTANSANKDMTHLSVMWQKLSELYGWEQANPFQKMRLKEDPSQRPPFDPEYVQNTLLAPGALATLTPEYRDLVHAMADTGGGIKELTEMMPADIHLDHDIPHIIIQPNEQRNSLKTTHRRRVIPLVGSALPALRRNPDGWPTLAGRNDSVSAAINKYLDENRLLPTDRHTLYSLRHTFQDRLTNAGVPDRIQADLMGHKFDRQKYGAGGSLETVRDWLLKIAYRMPQEGPRR